MRVRMVITRGIQVSAILTIIWTLYSILQIGLSSEEMASVVGLQRKVERQDMSTTAKAEETTTKPPEPETLRSCKPIEFRTKMSRDKKPKLVREPLWGPLPPRMNASSVDAVWAEEIQKRKEHIRGKCAQYKIKTSPLPAGGALHQYWVDDHHKFIFCEIPKVGCTNWKKIMLMMLCNYNKSYIWPLGQEQVHEGLSYKVMRRLQSFKQRADSDTRLKNYKKVFFVRHPFERLVSFFRDKLDKARGHFRYYHPRIAGYVLRSMNKKRNVTNKMIMDYNVTFPEYIQYVINTKKFPDIHWGIQHSLCHPCSVDYDVIGRYETIVEDSNNLLKMLGIDEFTYPQSDNTAYAKHKTMDLVPKYFKALKPEMIKELQNIYKIDADILGYDLNIKL
ncbi:carbohydrate sulfotransferase 11 [Lingula anatina]|uniref:Carbohydrate sulfotransferase n=1 Tax=Lingula anatina TaxID=7574 RepID=A0A1S3HA76_LINAN|nr:carbohydrate sulfotransferase 11 [Lingula anatina]XP_013382369.1 carbohydrate sulfotransferase 11 [Lingula anatina]XP_013382371.1 carbohydrate sulfotransferase 11 [Lingula anatina]XP_013382372.1 carbohydrate sulfotransferase 11 [Lingula anatina]|eukprot:XP_013382368.1 carbohydrate sulfotransferase 11 [Lingula anatina]